MLCLVMVLIPVLTACDPVETTDDTTPDYTILELQGLMHGLTQGNEYNKYNSFTSSTAPTAIGDKFIIFVSDDKEGAFDENGEVVEVDITVSTVKSVKTGNDIYSVKAYPNSEKLGAITSAKVFTVKNAMIPYDSTEKYFASVITKNAENDEDIIEISVYNDVGTALITVSGTEDELEEKIDTTGYFASLSSPVVFQGNHIFILNDLYKMQNDGTAKLVKSFKDDNLFELGDEGSFTYLDGKYVFLGVETDSYDKETKLYTYTFNESFEFEGASEMYVPVGYEYAESGVITSSKYLIVFEKIVDVSDLYDGETYDFIYNDKAITREFYIWNILDGTQTKIDDIDYYDSISITGDAQIQMLASVLGVEISDVLPDDFTVAITVDMTVEDDLYLEKERIILCDESLNELQSLSTELKGTTEYELEAKLPNGDYIVDFLFGIIVCDKEGNKTFTADDEIIDANDKYIIGEKSIYDLSYNVLYTFAENEEVVHCSSERVYIKREITNEYTLAVTGYEYYVFDGTAELTKIFEKSSGSDNIIEFTDDYYYTRTVVQDANNMYMYNWTRSYYFYTGELVATLTGETAFATYDTVQTTNIKDGVVIYQNKPDINGNTVYMFYVLEFGDVAPAV